MTRNSVPGTGGVQRLRALGIAGPEPGTTQGHDRRGAGHCRENERRRLGSCRKVGSQRAARSRTGAQTIRRGSRDSLERCHRSQRQAAEVHAEKLRKGVPRPAETIRAGQNRSVSLGNIQGFGRLGQPGKLRDVIRHKIRGIAGDEDLIAANYRERGLEPPEDVKNPPAIIPAAYLFWLAYSDLQHDRPPALYYNGKPRSQRIPWTKIAQYARFHGINVDELKRVVWALDDELAGAATFEEEKANG